METDAHIVVAGNLSDGFEFIGPFDSFDAAAAYADRKIDGESWIAGMHRGQGAGIVVPADSLWQSMHKEHLDPMHELTEAEWREFVNEWQLSYAEKCTEVAAEMMAEWRASRPTTA